MYNCVYKTTKITIHGRVPTIILVTPHVSAHVNHVYVGMSLSGVHVHIRHLWTLTLVLHEFVILTCLQYYSVNLLTFRFS